MTIDEPARQPVQHIGGNRNSDASVSKASAFFLVAYLVAKPFYFFPSGRPQICDFIVPFLLISVLVGRKAPIAEGNAAVLRSLLYFSIYTVFVNLIWGMVAPDPRTFLTPVFYLFNTAVAFSVISMASRDEAKALKILMFGVILSIAVQAFLYPVFGALGIRPHGRNPLFFNNPNQLGYWVLLMATIFSILSTRVKTNSIITVLIFIVLFYSVSISLSKAASISFFLLLVMHFSRKASHLLVAALIGLIVFGVVNEMDFWHRLEARLGSIGNQADDSPEGRGYDRIWLYPEMLLFGAGEWGFQKFEGIRAELHSTLGTVLFSYGIIGFGLFSMIFWRLFRLGGLGKVIYLAPTLIYGLTHQGLRFTVFWILIAVVSLVSSQAAAMEAREANASANTGDDGQRSRPP